VNKGKGGRRIPKRKKKRGGGGVQTTKKKTKKHRKKGRTGSFCQKREPEGCSMRHRCAGKDGRRKPATQKKHEHSTLRGKKNPAAKKKGKGPSGMHAGERRKKKGETFRFFTHPRPAGRKKRERRENRFTFKKGKAPCLGRREKKKKEKGKRTAAAEPRKGKRGKVK